MYILFSGGRIRGNRFYASGWCLGFLLGGAATGICAQGNGGFRRSCFYKAAFEEKDWGTIQVPGRIQLQGYDNCHYVNTMYPWDGRSEIRPPAIDWENAPAGSYVREFIITDQEKDFLEKRVFVSFLGVETAFYVWCNGQFAGVWRGRFYTVGV